MNKRIKLSVKLRISEWCLHFLFYPHPRVDRKDHALAVL